MTPGQQKLIDRLRAGPATTVDLRPLVGSPKTLNVQMHHLRAQGFVIETKKAWVKGGNAGSLPATYTLVREPGK